MPDGRTPEVERIAERVGERDAGRPIGLLPKTRGIEGDAGRLAAADSRGVELRADRDAGEGDQRVEGLAGRDGLAGARVHAAAFRCTFSRAAATGWGGACGGTAIPARCSMASAREPASAPWTSSRRVMSPSWIRTRSLIASRLMKGGRSCASP